MQNHQRPAIERFEQSQQQLREERLRQRMEPGVVDFAQTPRDSNRAKHPSVSELTG
jgi:hypothetical protein